VIIEVSWNAMRRFINGNVLVALYEADLADRYILKAIQGPMELQVIILKSESANVTDYENNFQSTANADLTPVTISPSDIISTTLETDKTMGSDFNSTSWNAEGLNRGSIVAVWTSIDGSNSTMVIEGSDNDTDWNEIGSSGVTILSTVDSSQGWDITSFEFKYYRVAYKANNVTTGTVDIRGNAGW